MEPIKWSDKYSLGVRKLDEENKRLIHTLNMLISEKDIDVKSETISYVLTEITLYANKQFKKEEELLAVNGNGDIEKHKKEHKEFRRKTIEFCNAVIDGSEDIPLEMRRYLVSWFKKHILETDMKDRKFFLKGGII